MSRPSANCNRLGQYFQNLYSDTEREHFDAQFKSQVDHQMQGILNGLSQSCSDLDSDSEIKKAVKLLKALNGNLIMFPSNVLCLFLMRPSLRTIDTKGNGA